ncbi:MAG: c-type cytochrome [Alphaproteobacteria bacterium]|nr:c-type cytochrome [Alphaproteobacteria bacterium]MCB9794326.1 c-type cytochrome [Alphaproteobacteria bacterium]
MDTSGFTVIPEGPTPEGDAQAGISWILGDDYQTCGIPWRIYDETGGLLPPGLMPEAQELDWRQGRSAELPHYLSGGISKRGVPVVNTNCLLCHSGTVNGELVVGLGNAHMPSKPLNWAAVFGAEGFAEGEVEETELDVAMQVAELVDSFILGTIGTNHGDATLLGFALQRDPETMAWLDEPQQPIAFDVLPYDVPPWWHMAKKNAMFTNAAVQGDYTAFVMNGSMACTETRAQAEDVVAHAADVRAFVESVQPPAWPFAEPDARMARKGERLFEQRCADCHGTYGEDETYPNLVVPVGVVGTDAAAADQLDLWLMGWDLSFKDIPFGEGVTWGPEEGYVAPPLDGIWATAPYLHNGSVPTLEQLLDSTQRPEVWARVEYEGEDYDRERVGLAHEVLDAPEDAEDPLLVYDTLRPEPGFTNVGHTFGDSLTPEERAAVIEYLKTL